MLNQFGLDRNEVVYFEHNPDAVKSAQSVGITTYWYDNEKKDLTSLNAFLSANAPEGKSGAVGEMEDFKP